MNYVPKPDDKLVRESATVKFRGEEFEYVYSYYVEPNGQRYTTSALDDENIGQVYRQYRERHGIPSPEDIKTAKKDYGLTNNQLSIILGMSESQLSDYIDGAMPSEPDAKKLAVIQQKEVLAGLISEYHIEG